MCFRSSRGTDLDSQKNRRERTLREHCFASAYLLASRLAPACSLPSRPMSVIVPNNRCRAISRSYLWLQLTLRRGFCSSKVEPFSLRRVVQVLETHARPACRSSMRTQHDVEVAIGEEYWHFEQDYSGPRGSPWAHDGRYAAGLPGVHRPPLNSTWSKRSCWRENGVSSSNCANRFSEHHGRTWNRWHKTFLWSDTLGPGFSIAPGNEIVIPTLSATPQFRDSKAIQLRRSCRDSQVTSGANTVTSYGRRARRIAGPSRPMTDQ